MSADNLAEDLSICSSELFEAVCMECIRVIKSLAMREAPLLTSLEDWMGGYFVVVLS